MRPPQQLFMSVTVLAACSSFLLLMGASASPGAIEPADDVTAVSTPRPTSTPRSDIRAVQPRTIRPAPLPPVPSPVPVPSPSVTPEPEPDPEPEPKPEPDAEASPDVPVIADGDDRRAWLAAGGESRDPIDRGGRRVRWSLEVEAATGLDVNEVLRTAEAALYDQRSWAREYDFVRGAPSEAVIRVLIATPETVDRLCAEAGLNTAGWLSCWNGSVAAINLDRWQQGTREIRDLDLYRAYVVNHEVGHGLGRTHVECGGDDRLADVMQQQTKSLDGCRANPWAYPDA